MELIGIINASPLICLGKIGALDLLPQLFDKILTTKIVRNEVLQKEPIPERIILESAFSSWLEVKTPKNNLMITKLQELQLHQGEASVLVLAKEFINESKGPVTIIDDLSARYVAQTMKIPIIGTLGILLRAVESEIISSKQYKKFLRQLIDETTFHMTAKIYSRLIGLLEERQK